MFWEWFWVDLSLNIGTIILCSFLLWLIVLKIHVDWLIDCIRLGIQALVWYICMVALILLHNHLKFNGERLPLPDVIRTSGEAEAAIEYFNKLINRSVRGTPLPTLKSNFKLFWKEFLLILLLHFMNFLRNINT